VDPRGLHCFSPAALCADGPTARTVARETELGLGEQQLSHPGYRSCFTYMDDPMQLGRHAAIPLREVVIRTSRSSGPGGQHANVTASRVETSFDVAASSALTDEQKRRIIARAGPRVVAIAQDARGQARNRELALERLRRRLTAALAVRRPRRPTRPTHAATRQRLEAKRRQAERKRARRSPTGDE
jgi:ribosome-associated protein